MELVESEIEQKKPIKVDSSSLTYAKLKKIELYFNISTELCDTDKYGEMQNGQKLFLLTICSERSL